MTVIGGDAKEVGAAMACAIKECSAPATVKISLLRQTIKEIKSSQDPQLVNDDIGKLATPPPHANPIKGTMVSSTMGGSTGDINPAVITSTYFLPLLRLACTYLVIKDARMAAGITEPVELHELGYEGTDSLGGVRAPRADGDGAAAQPPSARWEGITDSVPNCLKDRIHAIGRALPAGTRTFPSITEKDIASVKRHAWSEMQGMVDDGEAASDSAVGAAVAMGRDEWKNHPKLTSYLKVKWSKQKDIKSEYLNKAPAAAPAPAAAATPAAAAAAAPAAAP